MINYNSHHISKKDIAEVNKVLKSSNLTQGKFTKYFENSLSNYFKSKYALTVSNGTAALILALKAINLSKNDKVIVPSNSFLATANSVEICGGHSIFADIDPNTYTIDVNMVENLVIKNNFKIKAIIGVDYAGHPCDWKKLKNISKKYGIFLINDNCHAMGSKINGNLGYACNYADIVCQSYHAIKNFTTGEGGAILTNSKFFYKKILALRSHGITERISYNPSRHLEFWKYSMTTLGYNFRLSDIQSSLGISQLRSLNKFIVKRRKIADFYNKKLKNIEALKAPFVKSNIYHSYHLYPILINFKKIGISKKLFMNLMYKKGVNLQVNYIPIHTQHYYKKKYRKISNLENTEEFYEKQISLPVYYDLSIEKCKYVIHQLLETLNVK